VQDTTTTTTTSAHNHTGVPNSTLYFGQDQFGNHLQALVPFGLKAELVFRGLSDWDGEEPIQIATVYGSGVDDLIEYAHRLAAARSAGSCSDFDPTPW
jgi:hypothetical protein